MKRPLSPTYTARMLADPNYAAVKAQMNNGLNMGPAKGGAIEAIARALTGGLAGMNSRDLEAQYQNAEDTRNKSITDALALGRDLPAQTQSYGDGTTINWNERPGSVNNAIDALSANPETIDLATTLTTDQIKAQNELNMLKAKSDYEKNAPLTMAQRAEQIVGMDGTVVPKYNPSVYGGGQAAPSNGNVLLPPPALSGEQAAQPTSSQPTAAQSVFGSQRTPTVETMSPKAKLAYDQDIAKTQAEKMDLYRSQVSKLPQLEEVVSNLNKLADTATYTAAGNIQNTLRRETGVPVTQGGIDKVSYTSTIDNVLLPLLRETFGAQFTAEEGNRLRNTLGDANLSPQEKKAALDSFIVQKKRNISALESELGITPQQPVLGAATSTTTVPQPAQPAGLPKVGQIEDDHEFLGGNPADPKSWRKVR